MKRYIAEVVRFYLQYIFVAVDETDMYMPQYVYILPCYHWAIVHSCVKIQTIYLTIFNARKTLLYLL